MINENNTNMTTLGLENRKTTKGTEKMIIEFIRNNKCTLSNELKIFYLDVAGMVRLQLTKPAKRRMSMKSILERMYDKEKFMLAAGCIEYTEEYL